MKILTIALLTLTLSAFGQEEDDCIFDQATQTDEFVKSIPEFSKYTWNSETKEATINLSNNEVLIAQRGGCYHFGISGTLLTNDQTSFDNLNYWFDRCLWIAERLFSENDFRTLKKSIEDESYSMPEGNVSYILFPHEYYSEFSMTLKKNGNKVEIYIGYYFA